jgi:hypothetical protein
MSLDEAIVTLQRELTDIHDTMRRCARCECFLVVAAQARIDLRNVESSAAREARARFGAWLDEAEGRVKTCNNCEVCVPSGPYQRFTAELAGARRGEPGRPQDACADGCRDC